MASRPLQERGVPHAKTPKVTEKAWWNAHVRPQLHQPARGLIAKKVQDIYNGGLPDVAFLSGGRFAWLELKYAARWPVRARHLPIRYRPAQRAWLREWSRAGGQAYVLLGVAREWYLFDPEVPDPLPLSEVEFALVAGDRASFDPLVRFVAGL